MSLVCLYADIYLMCIKDFVSFLCFKSCPMYFSGPFDRPLRHRRSTYDIVGQHTISYTMVYTIYFFAPFLNPQLQDTLCLVAPYPFRLEPLEDFVPLFDSDMTGGDDVWFARSHLFFSCSLCLTGKMEDKSSHSGIFSGVLQHI
jgi:hypothetical protein